jgi:hypothetical protein
VIRYPSRQRENGNYRRDVMTVQRPAEIIRVSGTDAFSSTVNLNVDKGEGLHELRSMEASTPVWQVGLRPST